MATESKKRKADQLESGSGPAVEQKTTSNPAKESSEPPKKKQKKEDDTGADFNDNHSGRYQILNINMGFTKRSRPFTQESKLKN
jgi:hypothetical protein